MKHESDNDTSDNRSTWNNPKEHGKETGWIRDSGIQSKTK